MPFCERESRKESVITLCAFGAIECEDAGLLLMLLLFLHIKTYVSTARRTEACDNGPNKAEQGTMCTSLPSVAYSSHYVYSSMNARHDVHKCFEPRTMVNAITPVEKYEVCSHRTLSHLLLKRDKDAWRLSKPSCEPTCSFWLW
jgi:hypothetical protein